jgi:uncharacterized protein (DUF433 family)
MSIVIDANPVPLRMDADGVLRVGQTRVTLDVIISAHHRGETPEAISEQYPAVSVAEVYAIVGFYLRRRLEVDAYLDQRSHEADALRKEIEELFPPGEFREQLLSRARKSDQKEA